MVPYVIYNKKKGTSIQMAFDTINNGFKGFPIYGMFDYDTPNMFEGGGTFGPIVDEAVKYNSEEGYYITKDEFLKAWNEATYY